MVNKVPHRLAFSPARLKEHDLLHVLMLHEHITKLSHTLQYSKVEYTPVVREEIRLIKIMDIRDMQIMIEMARLMKDQWKGRSIG